MAGSSVRLITLKFSFSNLGIVPSSVKRLGNETPEGRDERKKRSDGVLAIRPVQNVSLVEFLSDLQLSGYELIDAYYQQRLSKEKRAFHTVLFVFCKHEYVRVSEEFGAKRDTISAELCTICRQAAWRVRAFVNPFYGNGGEKVPGQATIGINLEARRPLFHADNQPIMAWRKGPGGERIGDVPIPLKPDYYLRLENNAIRLTEGQ